MHSKIQTWCISLLDLITLLKLKIQAWWISLLYQVNFDSSTHNFKRLNLYPTNSYLKYTNIEYFFYLIHLNLLAEGEESSTK
jgi:hypothetical protein